MALDRDDLISGLRSIVSELRERGESAGIRIVGGAALNLRYFDRPGTDDIDASIRPPTSVLEIAHEIAEARGWPSNWLNTDPAHFIPIVKGSWESIFDDEGISIWVASPEMLLAMKLRASRPGRDEDDMAQLLSLCRVTTSEQAEELFESLFPGEVLQEKAFKMLRVIFASGLPEAPIPPARPELG